MSNAVQTISNTLPQFTAEQMGLITSTIAKGATPDELKLFLYRCQNLGLDPLKPGQIYFIKYGSSPGTIVVGIEGFRARAGKTGKLSGIKRGAIRDDKGHLVGAYAEVYRSDWKEPAREEVPLSEYNTGKGNWAKMPETMIKKVAEAAALRMAFPDDLGGVYTQEEMDQAEKDRSRITPSSMQPDEDDGAPEQCYRITFGKYAKRSLEEVGVDNLRSYVDYLESSAVKQGKEITGQVKDFIERASDFIAAFENGPTE
jgi:phage recombination protein Bet